MTNIYENDEMVVANPYAVAPAQGVSMTEAQRHDSGNALAANAEARVVAEVKAQVLMAKQFPRDPSQSTERILCECARPMISDAAVYSFPRGKEIVSGPSIRLAEVMARNWGNNTFGMEVLERKKDMGGVGYSVIRAFAWDLETNTYISRQFELKHWRSTKNGGYALTEDRDIYELEANMGSRRMRACVLQMIPGDVTSMAVAACKKTTTSGLAEAMADLKKREALIARTIKVYEKTGLHAEDLEEYLSARKEDWTADNMLRLKELKNSLDDGVFSIGDIFPHLAGNDKNALVTKGQAKELMEAAKATDRQGEISDRLKEMGIPKFADTPAVKFDTVMSLIRSFKGEDEKKTQDDRTIQPQGDE